MKRRVSVEIDLDALKRNYVKIAARVEPAGVLSVLKATAYGLGVAEYAKALFEAKEAGVEIFAVDCKVTSDGIFADEQIPVYFSE